MDPIDPKRLITLKYRQEDGMFWFDGQNEVSRAGEEFRILISHIPKDVAQQFADSIHKQGLRLSFEQVGSQLAGYIKDNL